MEDVLLWVVVVVVAVLIGVLAWFSVQSLLQGCVLLRSRNAPLRGGSLVAVHGPVRIVRAVDKPGYQNSLWYKIAHQERRGWGKNRRWVTVGREEDFAHFSVEREGARVIVEDEPSERQGTKSRTEYDSAWFSSSRTVYEWLDAPAGLTVLGRLESRGEGFAMRKDPRVGLLLSPYRPGWAATWGVVKGVLGLAVVAVVLYAGTQLLGGRDPFAGL